MHNYLWDFSRFFDESGWSYLVRLCIGGDQGLEGLQIRGRGPRGWIPPLRGGHGSLHAIARVQRHGSEALTLKKLRKKKKLIKKNQIQNQIYIKKNRKKKIKLKLFKKLRKNKKKKSKKLNL
jgi:hypothetical protein